ncbi:MAG: hypothetical protein OQJ97_15130 [Rhodospirillales bacterium]|nr:hypothetical protein [Rhodospirillales bacterium]
MTVLTANLIFLLGQVGHRAGHMFMDNARRHLYVTTDALIVDRVLVADFSC